MNSADHSIPLLRRLEYELFSVVLANIGFLLPCLRRNIKDIKNFTLAKGNLLYLLFLLVYHSCTANKLKLLRFLSLPRPHAANKDVH